MGLAHAEQKGAVELHRAVVLEQDVIVAQIAAAQQIGAHRQGEAGRGVGASGQLGPQHSVAAAGIGEAGAARLPAVGAVVGEQPHAPVARLEPQAEVGVGGVGGTHVGLAELMTQALGAGEAVAFEQGLRCLFPSEQVVLDLGDDGEGCQTEPRIEACAESELGAQDRPGRQLVAVAIHHEARGELTPEPRRHWHLQPHTLVVEVEAHQRAIVLAVAGQDICARRIEGHRWWSSAGARSRHRKHFVRFGSGGGGAQQQERQQAWRAVKTHDRSDGCRPSHEASGLSTPIGSLGTGPSRHAAPGGLQPIVDENRAQSSSW